MKSTDFDKAFFLGKITASVAHDLQNVLAVVKETSGLMQDYLLMSKDALPPDLAGKLGKNIASVQQQVARGVGITSALNGFAHTSDSPEKTIDVLAVLQRALFLTQRIFQHKGITVKINEYNGSPSLFTDPLLFQKLIFECIQYIADFQPDMSSLNIFVKNDAPITLEILRNVDFNPGMGDGQEILQEIYNECDAMNGEISMAGDQAGIFLNFR